MITLEQSMIKELSLAIFFGLLIGLGLTGTFYFLKQNQKQSLNNNQVLITTPTPYTQNPLSPSPTNGSPSNSTLTVTSPQNNDIVTTSKITLKGQSNAPKANLIVTTLNKNYHTLVAADGTFSQDIDLEPGLNDLQLTLVNSQDQETHIELFVTYSTAKF